MVKLLKLPIGTKMEISRYFYMTVCILSLIVNNLAAVSFLFSPRNKNASLGSQAEFSCKVKGETGTYTVEWHKLAAGVDKVLYQSDSTYNLDISCSTTSTTTECTHFLTVLSITKDMNLTSFQCGAIYTVPQSEEFEFSFSKSALLTVNPEPVEISPSCTVQVTTTVHVTTVTVTTAIMNMACTPLPEDVDESTMAHDSSSQPTAQLLQVAFILFSYYILL